MKRLLVVIALLGMMGGSTLAWAQLPHFNTGDVLHASDLNAIVNRINALGGPGGPPQTISVDCNAGGTIGQALDQANPGDIIQATGTCNETVLIIKDGITLDGQGTTTVDSSGTQRSAIRIDGAQRVTVQGLVAQGDVHGVNILRGAAVILHNITAQNNAQDGIRIDESATAQVTDCTASHNGHDGILAFRSGSVTLER